MMRKQRILTSTHNKMMVRDKELGRVLNKTEIQTWNDLINKIKTFDDKEIQRIIDETEKLKKK